MCQALQDMKDESWAEGNAEGMAKGRAEGRIEGRIEGKAEGRAEGIAIGETQKAQEIAKNFYSMGIDIEKIAQGVGCAVETVKQWLEI